MRAIANNNPLGDVVAEQIRDFEKLHGKIVTAPIEINRPAVKVSTSASMEVSRARSWTAPKTVAKKPNPAREQAIKNGEKHYEGTPCAKAGHTLRNVKSQSCVQCEIDNKRIKRSNQKGKRP